LIQIYKLYQDLYRLGEIAKILDISERQVYRMVSEYAPGNKRTLDSIYSKGGQHLVSWEEIESYIGRNNKYANDGCCMDTYHNEKVDIWSQVQRKLTKVWNFAYIYCDNYLVKMYTEIDSLCRTGIVLYIDCKQKQIWLQQDCEIRRRFLYKKGEKYFFKWPRFDWLKSHITKNNQNITLG